MQTWDFIFFWLFFWLGSWGLDTRIGAPGYASAMVRHFYPDVCFL
jgi:hypothetical protein